MRRHEGRQELLHLHPTLCCGVLPYRDYHGVWRCSICDQRVCNPT